MALVVGVGAVVLPVRPASAAVPPQLSIDAVRVELPATVEGTPSASEVVTVTNLGPGTMTGLTVGQPDLGYVDRTTTCGSTLAAGATCTVSLRLDGTIPVLDGQQVYLPARIRLTAAGGASALITAEGAVVASAAQFPWLQVTPRQLELGPAALGSATAPKTVTIRNQHDGPVAGLSSLTSPDARFEIVDNTCSDPLPAGGTCTYGVRYRPTKAGLPVSIISAPQAPYNLITVRGGGPYTVNQAFSRLVFCSFINRTPTFANIVDMARKFDAGTESKRTTVTRYALSEAWTADFVANFFYYQGYGSTDAYAKAKPYVAQLRAGERSRASVEVELNSSDETFAAAGKGSIPTWVDWLYVHYLNRPSDASGRAYWIAKAEANGRSWVVAKFYDHIANRRRRVEVLYNNALNRPPDPSGMAYWSERIRHDGDVSLMINLTLSPEFLRRSQAWPLNDPSVIPD